MRDLIALIVAVVGAFVLFYGLDQFSLVAAHYFNDHTAIQFLNWMYCV